MRLDRNVNEDRSGKYALVHLRKLKEAVEKDPSKELALAVQILEEHGVIQYGHEGPGEQFFVMKYKDVFTHEGLRGYAFAVSRAAEFQQSESLREYARDLYREVEEAQALGCRIPD